MKAELDRRFPGRGQRGAADPEGLRAAWVALEEAWATAVVRAAELPAGSVDVSADGEWSFAQTLRHLVLATDVWLRKAILGIDQPFHPIGQLDLAAAEDGLDVSVLTTEAPSYETVLQVRAERQAMVRELLATVTADELDTERRSPWAPEHPETTRPCLQRILEEEWEHLRYALRDLDAIEADRR